MGKKAFSIISTFYLIVAIILSPVSASEIKDVMPSHTPLHIEMPTQEPISKIASLGEKPLTNVTFVSERTRLNHSTEKSILHKLDRVLYRMMDNTTDPIEIIVTFRSKRSLTIKDKQLLRDLGIEHGVYFKTLPIAGVLATPQQISNLSKSTLVKSIFYNSKISLENNEATSITGVKRARKDPAFTKFNNGVPITGKGIGILINDSGVDGTHNDHKLGENLVQNVSGAINLSAVSSLLPITYQENINNSDLFSGHGTHVAGIVGGRGIMSSGLYEGVAPGANLIGYGSSTPIGMIDVLGGFDYALTHQYEYGIRVITNSWGTTSDKGTDFNPNHPISVATKLAFDHGIVVVFSAGNSGRSGADTITGNYKKAPWVITVAAGTNEYKLADFSSKGKDYQGTVVVDGKQWIWRDRPTITAPGVGIKSTRAISASQSQVNLINDLENPYYTTKSGTSMAAPHVAGIVALMLEVNKKLSPLEIKNILKDTALPMNTYQKWETGAGYVNAYKAIQRVIIDKTLPPSEPTPPGATPPGPVDADSYATIVIHPKEIIQVGFIDVAEGTELLKITGDFSVISGVDFPDLNVLSPNKIYFGYSTEDSFESTGGVENVLSTSQYSEINNKDSTLAKYSGWTADVEYMTFHNPTPGRWWIQANCIGGTDESNVKIKTNLDWNIHYKVLFE